MYCFNSTGSYVYVVERGGDQIKKTVANNAHLKQVSYVHVLEQHAELFAVTWAQIMQPICL